MIRPLALLTALLALLPLAGPAAAASPVSLEVAVVSDYRWRGLSLTDPRPTPQATLTANGPRGSYAFLWGSPVANSGPDVEVQLGGGIAQEVAGTTLDLSAAYSLYPGVKGSNLFELTGTASRPLGPVELGLTLVYAPVQRSTGGKRNLYTEVSGRVPVAKGLAVRGTLGR
jgi:uncharacterized protein (TIGR02001 family)